MDEKYTGLAVHLQEVDSRCKSNEHRLDNHDKEISELRSKQDAIYELTSSVKSIATDMAYMKDDLKEVKQGQSEMKDKVIELENTPAKDTKKKWDNFSEKIIWVFVARVVGFLFAQMFPTIF